MAEWKQTLEPYIKVQERVMTTALNPTVGEDLIVGVTFISDAGPSNPTLITGQKEFLKTYASSEVTKDYLAGIDSLYSGEMPSGLASTMWANAYRLAGSTTLLCVRASKGDNTYFTKPLLETEGQSAQKYVLKDGELLKSIDGGFKLSIDDSGDESYHNSDGWSINVRGVGIFGNRVTDEGIAYDYYVPDLMELVERLNETSKFFSPDYEFYKGVDIQSGVAKTPAEAKSVVFREVYLAPNFLAGDSRTENPADEESVDNDLWYLVTSEIDSTESNINQKVVILNDRSNFEPSEYLAINVYNSKNPLRVRIRRFNHDAVVNKTLSNLDIASLERNGDSPYTVLSNVLDTYTNKGTEEVSPETAYRDFFEIAVFDPSINETVNFFNVGNIPGRGDLEVSEVNSLLNMVSLNLPEDLHDLGLEYYDYNRTMDKSAVWRKIDSLDEDDTVSGETLSDVLQLYSVQNPMPGMVKKVGTSESNYKYYRYVVKSGLDQSFVDLTIDPTKCKVLNVSDSDLLKAMDKIQENEVYVVEGLCDLGNTDLAFQNYLANMAKSEDGNYFYPISSINSTNYLTIGNGATKLSAADSYKHYLSAPWDIDTGTLGIKFFAAPSVLFWEGVSRNYRDGRPYASLFGQTYGRVSYQRPVCEFNKRQRELLLSRKVNTVMWNTNAQIWQMNDNYTMQAENTIMNDEGNVRMGIHIAKVQPHLLAQFIGKKITEKLCEDIRRVEEYWINNNIMNLDGNVPEDVQVFCSYDADLARQNKVRVVINVRFSRALKYVTVVDRYFDTGMDISSAD